MWAQESSCDREGKDSGGKQGAAVIREESELSEPQKEAKGKHACMGVLQEGLNNHPWLWVLSPRE